MTDPPPANEAALVELGRRAFFRYPTQLTAAVGATLTRAKAGAYMATVDSFCGSFYGVRGYYCQTSRDECSSDSECGARDGFPGRGYCAYTKEQGRWMCSYSPAASPSDGASLRAE